MRIAILGRQSELGLIELESTLGSAAVEPFGRQTVLVDRRIDLALLGGVIKVGQVIYRGAAADINQAPWPTDQLPIRTEGKTVFGLSFYGIRATPQFVLKVGLTLKKRLSPRGSLRLVAPQTNSALTSAQLKFNHLIDQGFELIVAVNGGEMVIALTEQFQDLDWYSQRDYQRPARNPAVGLLPPKLAQVLINASGGDHIYDPFCGSGIVVQEALLAGKPAAGSDLNPAMVTQAKQNLSWLAQQVTTPLPPYQLQTADARRVKLPPGRWSIVTEGDLGPPLKSPPTRPQVENFRRQLEPLYCQALSNWAPQLLPDTGVALALPAWRLSQSRWLTLNLIDQVGALGYTVKRFKHLPNRPVIYGRSDQLVGRQIVILRRQHGS